MSTVWWWVVKPSETSDSSRPADAKLISTPGSGAEYNALIGGGTWQGIARYQGPFTSKSAAQGATPSGGSIWSAVGGGIPGISQLSDVARVLAAFYQALTNGKMWRSLGWILLGLALFLSGLFLWLGKDLPPVMPL